MCLSRLYTKNRISRNTQEVNSTQPSLWRINRNTQEGNSTRPSLWQTNSPREQRSMQNMSAVKKKVSSLTATKYPHFLVKCAWSAAEAGAGTFVLAFRVCGHYFALAKNPANSILRPASDNSTAGASRKLGEFNSHSAFTIIVPLHFQDIMQIKIMLRLPSAAKLVKLPSRMAIKTWLLFGLVS